jgi:Cu(I)/Ag(I) efflux system protein CusF
MKAMSFAVALAIASAALSAGVFAQMNHDHSMQPAQMQSSAPAKAVLADSEVRKVDRTNGTVTLKHGPLIALNMPPMTMTFVAKRPTLLANVKEGDKVRFTPEQGKDGTLIVSSLEVVKN